MYTSRILANIPSARGACLAHSATGREWSALGKRTPPAPFATGARQHALGARRFYASDGSPGEPPGPPVPTTTGKVKDAPVWLAIIGAGLLFGGGLVYLSATPKENDTKLPRGDRAA